MRKENKLDKAYSTMKKTYGKATEAEMKEAVVELEKEIRLKNDAKLARAGKEREELEKEVEELERKLTNLKGYTKNRKQINRIQSFKTNLEGKLTTAISKKEACEKTIGNIKKELAENEEMIKEETGIMQENLVQAQEELKKQLKESEEAKEKIEQRITQIKSRVSICNMAWRTLFVNKDWDEIKRRAIPDKKFTKKVEEKQQENTRQKSKPTVQKTETGINLPARISPWDKLKNWVKQLVTGKGKKEKAKDVTLEQPKKDADKVEEKEDVKKVDDREQFVSMLKEYAEHERISKFAEKTDKVKLDKQKAGKANKAKLDKKKEEQTR